MPDDHALLPGRGLAASRALRQAVVFQGVGLHTGAAATLRISPSDEAGIVFSREDCAGSVVPARVEFSAGSARRAALASGGVRIESVEHVLAALHGAGIWRARLALDGPEVPALDGSAAPFYQALLAASEPGGAPPAALEVRRLARAVEGRSAAVLLPAASTRVSARVDLRGRAFRVRDFAPERFADVAWARTFVYAEEVAGLWRQGLARGGSLDNAVVFGATDPLNVGGLRADDEPARHKVLDALGDLALLGAPLRGHLVLVRPSHRLTVALLRDALRSGAIGQFRPSPARPSLA
ncbi:MAG: UDP-3-O-acyl-N-acetylglucosamine deacetylase [Myxococcota bacterium]